LRGGASLIKELHHVIYLMFRRDLEDSGAGITADILPYAPEVADNLDFGEHLGSLYFVNEACFSHRTYSLVRTSYMARRKTPSKDSINT
jgi:hypothetical protein